MATVPTLHIHDADNKIDGFMVMNMFHVSRGHEKIAVHIDRDMGQVDCFLVGPDGIEGAVMVASVGKCGCP